jgi:hypothetical protein
LLNQDLFLGLLLSERLVVVDRLLFSVLMIS